MVYLRPENLVPKFRAGKRQGPTHKGTTSRSLVGLTGLAVRRDANFHLQPLSRGRFLRDIESGGAPSII